MTAALPITSPSQDWCIDDDTRDNVIARRNVLAGLWAARLMGYTGEQATTYAAEIHRIDYTQTGDADVVEKLVHDLSDRGLPTTPAFVRQKLHGFHRQALAEGLATD